MSVSGPMYHQTQGFARDRGQFLGYLDAMASAAALPLQRERLRELEQQAKHLRAQKRDEPAATREATLKAIDKQKAAIARAERRLQLEPVP